MASFSYIFHTRTERRRSGASNPHPSRRETKHHLSTLIYWFRADLRLSDNPALVAACRRATRLVPVYCLEPAQVSPWGFEREGMHRRHFLQDTLLDLSAALQARGSRLLVLSGSPHDVLPKLAHAIAADGVVCEEIAAPEEQAQVNALHAAGLKVHTQWQSSLLEPDALPFAPHQCPDLFTAFRQAVERASIRPAHPLPAPSVWPPLPDNLPEELTVSLTEHPKSPPTSDERSSFPYHLTAFGGGESAALAHVARYFSTAQVHSYKATRNGLSGVGYSSKFSPWLATGALSARTAYAALAEFESGFGASEGSYWLWFELLWRDHFRLVHLKHGAKLYRGRGLIEVPLPAHNRQGFVRWCQGRTGEPLVDAGMRELAATGYLSNRLRQLVASYLINDLGGDWRAGAAWFESQLLDYDVYSNHGNWLYIAGRGTDARGGRRFNPEKQTRDHDPAGTYRQLWSAP
jgi:deoxyribodipyrimidine photo-lyase